MKNFRLILNFLVIVILPWQLMSQGSTKPKSNLESKISPKDLKNKNKVPTKLELDNQSKYIEILDPEIIESDGKVFLQPGRRIKSSTYNNYIYSSTEFYAVYDKESKNQKSYFCKVASKKSRIEKSNSKKSSSPIGGFTIFDYSCHIPEQKLFSYHESVFESKPDYNKHKVTFILTKIGWMSYHKEKGLLHEVFNFDNGPDPIVEGHYRFVENGKMGLADEKGKTIIQANYDWVEPLDAGKLTTCNGCKKTYMGEHFKMEGGKWITIPLPKK